MYRHFDYAAARMGVAAKPTLSRVVRPVASRHRSIASRRATATTARLRARWPFVARNRSSGG